MSRVAKALFDYDGPNYMFIVPRPVVWLFFAYSEIHNFFHETANIKCACIFSDLQYVNFTDEFFRNIKL